MPLRLSLRRVFRRDFGLASVQIAPLPGDRFRECGAAADLWEVERVLPARGVGYGHVVLRDPNRRRPRRLVSQAALADLHRFTPLEDTAAPGGATAA